MQIPNFFLGRTQNPASYIKIFLGAVKLKQQSPHMQLSWRALPTKIGHLPQNGTNANRSNESCNCTLHARRSGVYKLSFDWFTQNS